ncbi:MAG: threonine--tRNA ligase [Bacteroidota bacterium]|nr:threonine--tRNA ligase [Bacteroidota bacterium]MDP4234794.1 threonine--tRNA ligase [Bacteroidota bacterium]MDP4244106.1 threonine--tRNA ligase [Bacteroidota bacterium]MDP4289395.1 threonine--tRNA ligase [Bacteroidota bacterium]
MLDPSLSSNEGLITITLPDGSQRTYPRGTTGMEIAHSISPRLADAALGIFVNSVPFDLATPIVQDSSVRIVQWRDEEGKGIFWHSSAHLMAEAIEAIYPGTRFGIGPPIENGWYYDMELPAGVKLTPEDLAVIEAKMYELSKRDVPYRRISKEYSEAIEYFKAKGDWLKLELLDGLKGQPITFYEQGNFVDLCRGTHVPSTGKIKFPKLLSIAGAYWRGDEKRPMLTRVYGVSFPTKKELDEFITAREEAEKRDHRKIGKDLELFLISPKVGQGLVLWLPNGAALRQTLETFLKKVLRKHGYEQVITPHIGSLELYKTSGHYPYYKDSQFPPITLEDESYLLKPMNCPHHFTMFNSKPHSYRDLPVRFAEFGTVYRYEQSGELTGMSRVRGFTQDDAHLFMAPEQLRDELCDVIALTKYVSEVVGLTGFRARLSFRDKANVDKYGGSDEQWERAERDVREAADAMGLEYTIGIGEATFYGPKIDFMLKDAIGRSWQLGTVQVDYVMPERFNMEYIGADGQKHRPVVIHRAPFGSFERFCSLLIEHYAGNFPTWLAPVQVVVLPITDAQEAYAEEVYAALESMGIRAKLDASSEKVNARIRDHELKKVPVMLVLGEREREARAVAIRRHGKGNTGTVSLEEALAVLQVECAIPE